MKEWTVEILRPGWKQKDGGSWTQTELYWQSTGSAATKYVWSLEEAIQQMDDLLYLYNRPSYAPMLRIRNVNTGEVIPGELL